MSKLFNLIAMKNFLLGILGVLLIPAGVYAYTIMPGDTLTKISNRFGVSVGQLVSDNAIKDPDLIYAGDELAINNSLGAGYTPVTGYESRTTQYVTAAATTIPVASTKDKSGTQIDLSNISTGTVKVYLNLEPGGANEEPIVCTGVTSASWTGCTRGLAFQGSSEVSVSANQKSHNAGSKIILTNIGQFYNQYVSVDGDQTINDIKTFTTFPRISTSTNLPSNNGDFATKFYVDSVGAGGFTAVNVSTTRGLSVDGSSPEKVGVNASSTTGMAFDANGKLYQKTSSTKGIASDSNGVYLDTTQARSWTGQHTFTVTTTLATTTVTTLNATAINIGGTSTAPLVNGAVTTLHAHDDTRCVSGFGWLNKNISAGTTTVTTGIDANYITINSVYSGGGASSYGSIGYYDAVAGTTACFAQTGIDFTSTSSVYMMMSYNGANPVTAKITATSTTGFSLYNDTISNNGTGWPFMWRACK